MKYMTSSLLTLCLLLSPALADQKKASFDAGAAWTYIKDLAADSMEGRESGENGGLAAAKYIAAQFRDWGLESGAANGNYIQDFAAEHQKVGRGGRLKIESGPATKDFSYGEGWYAWNFSGSGDFTAEVVFVGYGIHAPLKGYDDYAGVDVKGKLALFVMDSPAKLEKELKEEAGMQQRVKAAQDLGARGVLFCPIPYARNGSIPWMLKKDIYRPDFVILHVGNEVTDYLFKDLKTEMRDLLEEMDSSSKPMAYATGVMASVSVNSIFDEKRPMMNVLAKITGTDKKLKNEYVIIGAHMDHLGVDPTGDILNGADDNASGTAVVMEIARVLKLTKAKPKRTIVFALWAAEEQHLLGSISYVDRPLYPLEKTVAYLNFDMVGQGNGKLNLENIYYAPEVWSLLNEKLPGNILDDVIPVRESTSGTSDYDTFLEKGIPGFAIMTDGKHHKYHQRRDDVDLIKPELLKKTGDFGLAALNILANEPGNWILPERQENFYLKQVRLTDYRPQSLGETLDALRDVKDPVVDLQLATVEEKKGLSGNALRIDILDGLFSAKQKVQNSKGLYLYSSSGTFRQSTYRVGKTALIAGLGGIDSFRDDPRWLEVLAKEGIFFVILESPGALFNEHGITEEGKTIVESLNKSGLLIMIHGLNADQAQSLLEFSKKPLVLVENELPSQEIMALIKKKNSVLGLRLGKEEKAETYFKNLDEATKAMGRDCLLIINEESLWEKPGNDHLVHVVSELLKASYAWQDITYPFSRSFLRVLDENRGGDEQRR
jgi:hypothetical protein